MHPVIDLILNRAREGSLPGRRTDNYRVGLAVEGGGMRGVVSGGMQIGLAQLGLRHVFDAVYGCSAGALNGAYFVGEAAIRDLAVYYREINNDDFINLGRLVTGKPVMSLDYLLDRAIHGSRCLDWQAVLRSKMDLKIVVSSVEKRKSVALSGFVTKEELVAALRASATIPVFCGRPVEINGDLFLDASLFESIPYRTAIEDGCTHVLALLTRPEGKLRRQTFFVIRQLIGGYLATLDPAMRRAFLDRPVKYAQEIRELEEYSSNPQQIPYVAAVRLPRGTEAVGQMEKEKRKLLVGAAAGRQAVFEAFTGERRLASAIRWADSSDRTVGLPTGLPKAARAG